MPPKLVEQLKPGGRLFIPVGTAYQDVWQVDKTLEGEIKSEKLFGCASLEVVIEARLTYHSRGTIASNTVDFPRAFWRLQQLKLSFLP